VVEWVWVTIRIRCVCLAVLAAIAARAAVLERFDALLPVTFEENRGQVKSPATHLAADSGWGFSCGTLYRSPSFRGGPVLTMALSGSATCQGRMAFEAPGVANYYRGAERSQWVEALPRFNILFFGGVAPGVDWQFQVRDTGIEWRWDLNPGVQSGTLRLRVGGSPYVGSGGELVADIGTLPRPAALQLKHGLNARWVVYPGSHEAAIEVENTNAAVPLTLSVTLPAEPFRLTDSQSTRDREGNWLVVASTDRQASLDSRTETCFISSLPYSCPNILVAKYAPGGELRFATYLAGSRFEAAVGIRADAGANIYVAGTTYSRDFPVTEDAVQHDYSGPDDMLLYPRGSAGGDAFAVKLYGGNGALIHSTFVGGAQSDQPLSFETDDIGRVTMRLAWQSDASPNSAWGLRLVRLHESFSSFDYDNPDARDIQQFRVARDSSLWVLRLARQRTVERLDETGAPVFSLELPPAVLPFSMSVAPDGGVWLSGYQQSENQSQPVLIRLTQSGADVRTGWPLGALETDAGGNAYLFVSGGTFQQGADLPLTADAVLRSPCAGSAYIARLSPDMSVEFGSYLLGFAGMGLDRLDVPILAAGDEMWALDLSRSARPFLACIGPTAELQKTLAPGALVTVRGRDIGPANALDWRLDADGRISKELGGARLLFGGMAAPLLHVEADRVEAVVPNVASTSGAIQVELLREGESAGSRKLSLATQAFGVFRILNGDGTVNSPDNPAALGSVIRILGSGAGATNPPGVDGEVGHPVLAKPLARLTASVASTDAEVLTFQQAPEWVSGVMEALVKLPVSLPEGTNQPAAELLLFLDGSSTTQWVKIAVK